MIGVKYIQITDPEIVEKIRNVRKNRTNWIKSFSGKVQKFGLKSGYFERLNGAGGFLEKEFIGAYGLISDHEKLNTNFKVIQKNATHDCHLYGVRRGNKDFLKVWEDEVICGNPTRINLNGLLPLIFSEVHVGNEGNSPISNIFWECIDGSVAMRLCYYGCNGEKWEVSDKHKTILKSEYLRLCGE